MISIARLREIVQSGMSARGIAETLGVSVGTVRRWCRMHDLHPASGRKELRRAASIHPAVTELAAARVRRMVERLK